MRRTIAALIIGSLVAGTGCVPPPSSTAPSPEPAPQPAPQMEEEVVEVEPQEPQEVEAPAEEGGEVQATVHQGEGEATIVYEENGRVVRAHVKQRRSADGEEEEVVVQRPDGTVIHYRRDGNTEHMVVVDPETGEEVEVQSEGE